MPYQTYSSDVRRSLGGIKGPAKRFLKSSISIDPGTVFRATFTLIVIVALTCVKIVFLTLRKICNA